ncbi:MAG TPA: DUF3303 family protein [Terriglobales bacterium]|nr:DUF3303 family protein [Terriglobales bacterium]
MLFVAEYELSWDTFEAAIAKRLEWEHEQPDDFRYIGEYVWADRDPPFRGVVVFEADGVEALNAFVLHYGPTLRVNAHAASDVGSAIGLLTPQIDRQPSRRGGRKQKRK